MPFTKGQKKTGGRKKGTQNKTTNDLKKLLNELVDIEAIKNDLEDITPSERLNFISKILPYLLPKISAVQLDVTEQTEQKVADYSKLTDKELETLYYLEKKVTYN